MFKSPKFPVGDLTTTNSCTARNRTVDRTRTNNIVKTLRTVHNMVYNQRENASGDRKHADSNINTTAADLVITGSIVNSTYDEIDNNKICNNNNAETKNTANVIMFYAPEKETTRRHDNSLTFEYGYDSTKSFSRQPANDHIYSTFKGNIDNDFCNNYDSAVPSSVKSLPEIHYNSFQVSNICTENNYDIAAVQEQSPGKDATYACVTQYR